MTAKSNPITNFLIAIIVCVLPNFSFGQQTVGLFLNAPEALNGYTLFGNNETTYLVNNCGFTINSWESNYKPGLGIYLLDNGHLLRTAKVAGDFSGGGTGGRFEMFNWEGDLIWSYEYANNLAHAHHDIEPLPNGNFLAIAWEEHSQSEAMENGRKYNGEVWSEQIIEIEIIGNNQANIVWEWSLWDHLIQDHSPAKLNYGNVSQHPELVDINYIPVDGNTSGDWIHLNAIDYNKELDQIIICSRNFSEVWIIDHSTTTAEAASHSGGNAGKGGDILYRFGNPATYHRGTLDDQILFQPHDARWSDDNQDLMVFNNRYSAGKSAVQMWSPPLIGFNYSIENDEPFGPDYFNWEYTSNGFYSKNMSGAIELENGNILICEADDGHLFELTKEKELVWEYINPVNQNGFPVSQGGTPLFNDLFRATKYAENYSAFTGKDLTPGPPVEINPWEIDCEITPTTNEENNIKPTNKINILGNPVTNEINIHTDIQDEIVNVEIVNALGKRVIISKIKSGINKIIIDKVDAGVYFLIFKRNDQIFLVEKIINNK